MADLKFFGVIPARYGSSRFPGKPLAVIGGKMMIQRVWERVISVLEQAVVATDDERIYNAVKSFGGEVVMTSDKHCSGTDRCNEAYKKVCPDADVIVNIQGDEPFIDPNQIKQLMGCFDEPDTEIATLILPFPKDGTFDQLKNPNRPKVLIDNKMRALYFSRSIIPYFRGQKEDDWAQMHQYYTHVGMYAYRSDILSKISEMPQGLLERAESLEQLRWIENGCVVRTAITHHQSMGIDTKYDLAAAEEYVRSMNI